MFFHIDASNGVPIFEQISRQVKYAVARGALRPLELVPSVRELAQRLTVNPNTVARAYRDLQGEDVLEPLRGEGLQVTRKALDRCRKDRQALLRQRLRSVVGEARQSGLPDDEILSLFQDELSRQPLAETLP